eukprot:c23981_g1_i2 orf=864-1883(+)
MNWTRSNDFVASASLHGGALVANYPWDGTSDGRTRYSMCDDDETFRYLAKVYSGSHISMLKSTEFSEGVTNGAAWYPLYGGMQDWNYIHGRCMDLTLEITENKWPMETELEDIWETNRLSMLLLVASLVKCGVHGHVVSSSSGLPIPASISVKGINFTVFARERYGDYHRLLSPGNSYEVTASMPGYTSRTAKVFVEEGMITRLDFSLDPMAGDQGEKALLKLVNVTDSDQESMLEKERIMRIHQVQNSFRKEDSVLAIRGQTQDTMSVKDKLWENIFLRKEQLKTAYDGDVIAELVTGHLKVTSICLMFGVLILFFFFMYRYRALFKVQKTSRHLVKL